MGNSWRVAVAVVVFLYASSSAASAAVWAEVGDAGDLPATAQETGAGPGPLTSVSGSFGANDADMYRIFINTPAAFSATTVGLSTTDTQLFLFDASGLGVYANDDTASGVTQSTLPAGNANSPTTAGFYYLAISLFDRDPSNASGAIFPGSFIGVFGPTGPGGGSPITGWVGSAFGIGTYTIALTGADPSAAATVPEATTLALLGSCLVTLYWQRRHLKKPM